jgi:DNA polymerase-4
VHNSPVQPSRVAKSVGAEHTFAENLSSEVFMLEKLAGIAAELESRLASRQRSGRTVTLKIRYSDFTLHTRSRTLPKPVSAAAGILETARELLYQEPLQNSVRLLGISLSNLDSDGDDATRENPGAESVSVQLRFDF